MSIANTLSCVSIDSGYYCTRYKNNIGNLTCPCDRFVSIEDYNMLSDSYKSKSMFDPWDIKKEKDIRGWC